jgi:hypothetical protein
MRGSFERQAETDRGRGRGNISKIGDIEKIFQ